MDSTTGTPIGAGAGGRLKGDVVTVAIGPVSVTCCAAHFCCWCTSSCSLAEESYAHESRSFLKSFLARFGRPCHSMRRSRKTRRDCSAWKLYEMALRFIPAISCRAQSAARPVPAIGSRRRRISASPMRWSICCCSGAGSVFQTAALRAALMRAVTEDARTSRSLSSMTFRAEARPIPAATIPATMIATKGTTTVETMRPPLSELSQLRKSVHHCMPEL